MFLWGSLLLLLLLKWFIVKDGKGCMGKDAWERMHGKGCTGKDACVLSPTRSNAGTQVGHTLTLVPAAGGLQGWKQGAAERQHTLTSGAASCPPASRQNPVDFLPDHLLLMPPHHCSDMSFLCVEGRSLGKPVHAQCPKPRHGKNGC